MSGSDAAEPLQEAAELRAQATEEGEPLDENAELSVEDEVEPSGFQDRYWADDDWRDMIEQVVGQRVVSWKEVAVALLAELNPPQSGTALTQAGFKENFESTEGGESLMRHVLRWLQSQSGRCVTCGTRLFLEADHVETRADFGSAADRLDNLVLRCRRHNSGRRHEKGGTTFLTASAALMWILLAIRPRNLPDFSRLCRLYGLTMAGVRFEEGWAMAHWLAKEDSFDIDANDGLYDILRWPDMGLTRRPASDDAVPADAELIATQSRADAVYVFIASTEDDPLTAKFYEIPVGNIPFTYDLGDGFSPSEAYVSISTARPLPPRGLVMVDELVRAAEEKVAVTWPERTTRPYEAPGTAQGRTLKCEDARDARLLPIRIEDA